MKRKHDNYKYVEELDNDTCNRFRKTSNKKMAQSASSSELPSQHKTYVSRTAVKKIEEWLCADAANSEGRVLLFMGPPGLGKTNLLRNLCYDRDIELMLWESPALRLTRDFNGNFVAYQNINIQFAEFIKAGTRFNPLSFDCSRNSGRSPRKCACSRLVVLDDFLPIYTSEGSKSRFIATITAALSSKFFRNNIKVALVLDVGQDLEPLEKPTLDLINSVKRNLNPLIVNSKQATLARLKRAIPKSSVAFVQERAPLLVGDNSKKKSVRVDIEAFRRQLDFASLLNVESESNSLTNHISQGDNNLSWFHLLGKIVHSGSKPDFQVDDLLRRHISSRRDEEMLIDWFHYNLPNFVGNDDESEDSEGTLDQLANFEELFSFLDWEPGLYSPITRSHVIAKAMMVQSTPPKKFVALRRPPIIYDRYREKPNAQESLLRLVSQRTFVTQIEPHIDLDLEQYVDADIDLAETPDSSRPLISHDNFGDIGTIYDKIEEFSD